MAVNHEATRVVATFKQKLLECWPGRILDVRIFGSVARNEARPDSDLDVFVLVDEKDEDIRRGIVSLACDIASQSDLSWWLSPFIVSQAQFADLQRRERIIARDIMTDGVTV